MSGMTDRSVLSEQHHGLVSLVKARDAGMNYEQVRHRIARGEWERLYEEVYLVVGVPRSWKTLLLAACWAGGPEAVASHGSAAALWDLAGGRVDQVEITCPRWRRAKEVGLVVHESKALDPADCRVVDNIPVTSPELTLLMLGAVCSPLVVEMALDTALRRNLLTYESTRELLHRIGRRGRNGAGVLRTVLAERVPERAIPESPMETRLLWLLRRLGFPEPVPQYEVRHRGEFYGRLDAAYPVQRVGVEFQSIEHHTGKVAILRDNDRIKRFQAIEWEIVPVTVEDFRNHGCLLAPALHTALRRAV